MHLKKKKSGSLKEKQNLKKENPFEYFGIK